MELGLDVPLDALDRAVRRAVQAMSAWQAALARSPAAAAGQAPLGMHRSVAGKRAFEALRARVLVSQDEPLRAALGRWVGALTVQRVTEDERAEEAVAEADPTALVHLDKVEKTSFRDAWKGLVRARNAAEADAWVAALAERGEAVAAVRRERAVREEEASRRLGFAGWSDLVAGALPATLDAAALAFLAETRELARSLRRETGRRGGAEAHAGTFAGVVVDAAGRDAPEGWPARLTVRSLVATFDTSEDLGRGLRVDPPLPEALGAASFARALESFGVAYRSAAAASSTLPFALAVDPFFVDAHRFGFTFGGLASSVPYQRRGLGLGADRAADQARALARSSLLHARTLAVSALLARDAPRPDRARFREWMHDVYGEGVPEALAGAFPRARGDEDARLQGLLTTLAFARLLRDRFDEDWFRNPAAWRYLRARAEGPARDPADEERADAVGLARAFEEALG